MVKILFLIVAISCCSCAHKQYEGIQIFDKKDVDLPSEVEYHVVGIHETYPDAKFNKISQAEAYVRKYKEFHDYRIVVVKNNTSEKNYAKN